MNMMTLDKLYSFSPVQLINKEFLVRFTTLLLFGGYAQMVVQRSIPQMWDLLQSLSSLLKPDTSICAKCIRICGQNFFILWPYLQNVCKCHSADLTNNFLKWSVPMLFFRMHFPVTVICNCLENLYCNHMMSLLLLLGNLLLLFRVFQH